MKYSELTDAMKQAMKAREKDRLAIIRQVKGEVDAQVKDAGKEQAEESDVDAAIKKTLKQAEETHEASVKAANDDERTARLAAQIEILKDMMPAQVEGAELEALVDATIAEVGAESMRDMGKIMGALAGKTGGNFDKAHAAEYAKGKLS